MKSECSEHQPKIAAYCLGDIANDEKQALEAHLASCSSCRSELEGYRRTIGQLAAVEDESVPRHFFVCPEERVPGLWQLFRRMPFGWRVALAGGAAFMLFVGLAGLVRLQVRADSSGWAVSFGKPDIDTAALKKEILVEATNRNREDNMKWTAELRSEIARSWNSLSKEQQAQFTAALAKMDSRLSGQIRSSEGHASDNTRMLVSDLYRVVAQQRARDLETINLRLDSTDANNAIKARQTNEILGTLLQVADAKFR
jgi:hypothetical protein